MDNGSICSWVHFLLDKTAEWINGLHCSYLPIAVAGADRVPAVDPVGAANGSSWREDNAEDHNDPEQDEGARPAGEILQVAPCQCS